MEFLGNFWSEIILAILTAAATVTALTETEKDDKIVNILARIMYALIQGKSRRKLDK